MSDEKNNTILHEANLQAAFNRLNEKIDSIATEIMELKKFINNGDCEKLIQRIDGFDSAMRAAKGTQEVLAGQIAAILESQKDLALKTMQRFDNYDSSCIAIKETQNKLFNNIELIARKIENLS